ncbi:MAG: OmpA family protein [Thermonemataceae bacterium]|nr:OmpA family protein [Thermonemataceae bacterium]
MKKIKLLYLFFAACLLVGNANAQEKWTVGFHYSAMDFVLPYAKERKPFETANWNEGVGVSLGYKVHPMFNLSANYTLSRVDKLSELSTGDGELSHFAVLNAEFHPLGNKEGFWFDPYLTAGGGLHRVGEWSYGTVGGGLGFNFWLTPGVAIALQSTYNAMPLAPKENNFGGVGPFDYWVHNLGLKFNVGKAKDEDTDGVPDRKDKCPNEAGKKELMGCPDRDNDGIADGDDACPDEAGTAEFKGCPDRDGDKVIDKDDACPDAAGLAALQGCPDKDGDGIADKDDACPDDAGLAALQGCPDKDGDGVADKDDACPDTAGLAALQGCPDKDGDGVADKDDVCPDVPGIVEEKGCPKKAPEEKILAQLAGKITFITGKATIAKTSYAQLNQLAALMTEYPDAKIVVEGHTDNVGNAAANKKLSQQRANAIKAYLVKKKIKADRITAVGYGSERPVDGSTDIKAANKTAAQKAANRRVEIKNAQ